MRSPVSCVLLVAAAAPVLLQDIADQMMDELGDIDNTRPARTPAPVAAPEPAVAAAAAAAAAGDMQDEGMLLADEEPLLGLQATAAAAAGGNSRASAKRSIRGKQVGKVVCSPGSAKCRCRATIAAASAVVLTYGMSSCVRAGQGSPRIRTAGCLFTKASCSRRPSGAYGVSSWSQCVTAPGVPGTPGADTSTGMVRPSSTRAGMHVVCSPGN